ncbi:hypothetical protein [Streptomyces sp. NBC_01334]|uniref:hypothetical protein n=1 Tax=Streptomyces sp. NBC_01334 TaxID=2903827 RepID=UPI002E12A6A6|nr:hypothetical protein OG736_01090 [Streptomyces sp. NBC_01334]
MDSDFVDAAEMLPVPKAAGPASVRIDGKRCVWCGGAASMDLGPRLSVIDRVLKRWEPRGCRSCAKREARRVHDIHITTCARCIHRDHCPESNALYALALLRQTR